ncbi:hypothetical protein [Nocardia wallacei]|uniref:hypothetical protein n=1 Tax=Nocardia wallacei TaxID=480035 RepID=UPI003CC7E7FA
MSSKRIRYQLSARHIRADEDRSARLVILLSGGIGLSQCDDAVRLRPGQLGMITMARPMTLAVRGCGRAGCPPTVLLPPVPRDYVERENCR